MPSASRSVRVFLSSTFRDFQEERDLLVRRIFPELRLMCREREVDLVEVDLRWGVTAEQSERGEVLPLCLNEIDRCRPYFVGMLGARYGWVPQDSSKFPPSVLEDPNLSWVEQQRGRSYTELEILHGVLNNPAMAGRAHFYFRDADYARRRGGDFICQDPQESARLEALKERIRASGHPVTESCPTPLDIAERIKHDLWVAIQEDFPLSEVPDALELQRLHHEAYAASRLLGYVPVAGLTEALHSLLDDERALCRVVVGVSGGGKSALLAHWLQQLRQDSRLPAHSFIHFLGSGPESSSLMHLLGRWMDTLVAWRVTARRTPDGLLERVRALPAFLEDWSKAGGGLLVLDALNQLDAEQDRTLWWLPRSLPAHIRLVASTLVGPTAEELSARGWMDGVARVSVAPLQAAERQQLIGQHLSVYRKQMERKDAEHLAAHPSSASPLFLKTVLEQLRLRASRRGLRSMMDELLAQSNVPGLFQHLMERLQAEHDAERPGLVRQTLGLLAVARRGLTESELLELLSDHPDPAHNPLPRALWTPLYLDLQPWLVSRDGRLGFFHQHVQKAVERAYLLDAEAAGLTHGVLGKLARDFTSPRRSPSLREYGLLWGIQHLLAASRAEEALELLLDPGFRRASALAAGGLEALRDDLAATAQRLMDRPDGEQRAWQLIAVGMAELPALRQQLLAEVDDAARAQDWRHAAACSGMALTATEQLMLACRATLTAGQSPGPAMQALAEGCIRRGVSPALEALWRVTADTVLPQEA